jgi:hypothetical protein
MQTTKRRSAQAWREVVARFAQSGRERSKAWEFVFYRTARAELRGAVS